MRNCVLVSVRLMSTAVAAVLLAPATATGQVQTTTAHTAPAPHTGWGDPDLRGIWSNSTITPFERPGELAGQQYLTEEEVATLERRAREANTDEARDEDAARGSVATFGITRESPLGGPHYTANPNTL